MFELDLNLWCKNEPESPAAPQAAYQPINVSVYLQEQERAGPLLCCEVIYSRPRWLQSSFHHSEGFILIKTGCSCTLTVFFFFYCNLLSATKYNIAQGGNVSPECMDRWINTSKLMVIWASIQLRTMFCSCLTLVSIHYISTLPVTHAAPYSEVAPWRAAPSGEHRGSLIFQSDSQQTDGLTGAAMQGA